jgi:hypothetical protein
MKDFTKRLERIYRRFLKLSPERRAEFLNILNQTKHLAASEDVLDLLNEFESILKMEAGK